LLRLLSRLNRQLFEPIVLLGQPGDLADRFRALNVPVVCLRDQPADRIHAAESQAIKRDIAATLERYGRPWADAYRDGKAWLAYGQHHIAEAVQIAGLLRSQQIDLVHLNNRLMNTRGAALAAVWTKTPCICHVRYYDPFYAPDRWLARRMSEFIFISRAVAEDTQARLPGVRGTVLYDGVSLTPELPIEDRRRVRAHWGMRDTDFVVGNVGRIVGWKGQDVFLRALAQLALHQPHLRALMVGDIDPPEDAAYLRQLHALIKELRLGDRVHFTGHCDNVPELMNALDAVAHTATLPEPFGLVVLEAMASGRPVVASAGGGVLDLVEDGVTGLLTPMRDEHALAQALARLASDSSLRQRLGVNGRNHVATHFTTDQFVLGVESVYGAALRRSGTRGALRSPRMGEQVLSNQR
jgi:glycosyltransferase involved in cell wall biosynthesis